MTRRPDWAERLAATIEAAHGRAVEPSRHDCGLFVADCILAMTGVDVAADWRGRYGAFSQGLALAGVRSVVGLPRKAGFAPVNPALAHRGDVAVARVGPIVGGKPQLALAVFDGAWLVGPQGARVPRTLALRAWRVT